MAFPDYTFWEEEDKRRRRITREKKSPTDHYSLLHVLDAPSAGAPGTGELSGSTEKIIILQSLPRTLNPGLPSWSFHAPLLLHWPVLHLQPPPCTRYPSWAQGQETWHGISCINAQFNWRALPSRWQRLSQKCLALHKVKNPEVFRKEYILWRKK